MKIVKLKSIYVFSYDKVKRKENFYSGALISIMDPDVVRGFDTSKYDYVLELNFDDDTFKDIQCLYSDEKSDDPNIFNEDMAKSVWVFVDKIKYKVQNLTIHCNLGLSRSPAIAESIYEVLKPHITCFEYKSYAPNKYVIEIMRKAYKYTESSSPI